jgi:hypothetical protein
MKYQICSKLYGSWNKISHLKPNATTIKPRLLMLGDCFPLHNDFIIKESKQLRDFCSNNWERVYVLPGMVEICGIGTHSWMNNVDKFEKFIHQAPNSNMIVMNNTEHHDGDNILIGSTFWCGGGPSTFINEAASNIIKLHPQLTIKEVNNWAKDDAEFMGTSIKNAILQKKKLTVCTYFSPQFMTDTVLEIFRKQLEHCASSIKGEWYTAQS